MSDEQRLAAALEGVFARKGRSLTDESTATDVLIILGETRKLLRGALEQGLVGEEGFQALDGMMAGMMNVPALLAESD